MSYHVIARKWRPQTFEEVTGQEVITQTLRNALEYDRLHHAYLFSGARGVGKTTTARILAKALNCHKTQDKPNLTPCKTDNPTACPSCIEISESRSMDVLEIDAASHTGIDDVRGTIIESINFNPARDRNKVFIIDEVHQLSKPAFNALLKTLEEPPSNVVFVMATTELHKVPETILSRCQEFEFRTIPQQKIFERLKLIADAEKIDISEQALREIARSGEGSMRDAQSNFDQVISFSGERIEASDVTTALGFAGAEMLSKALAAIAEREPRAVLAVVEDIVSRGHDMRNFCRDLLGLFRDLLVFKVSGGDAALFEGAVFASDELNAMAAPFGESDLVRFFNSLAETEASLREAVHPRYQLEIGLVKLIEMGKLTSIESILERLDALSNGVPLTATASAAAATEEKKTLKSKPPPKPAVVPMPEPVATRQETKPEPKPEPPPEPASEEPEFREIEEPLEDSPFAPGEFFDDEPAPEPMPQPKFEPERVIPTTIRLPRLTADELEHFDEKRLDEGYEEKLSLTGDDLMPLASARNLVTTLLGEEFDERPKPPPAGRNGSYGLATAPSYDVAKLKSDLAYTEDEDVELPTLSDSPTEAELRAYFERHPAIRPALRVFRGRIIEITKA